LPFTYSEDEKTPFTVLSFSLKFAVRDFTSARLIPNTEICDWR